MKVALITDTHFGVRQDRTEFHDNMRLFFSKLFFPTLKERNIDKVIHLGDIIDNRKKLDALTLEFMLEVFLDPLVENNIFVEYLPGNHDIYYRESLKLSAPMILLQRLADIRDHFTIVDRVRSSKFIPNATLVPWLCKENFNDSMRMLTKVPHGNIILGHFEFDGYNFSKLQTATHGQSPTFFAEFKHVYSGHYHHRHTKGNITYLGAPTEHTWINAGDPCGFHIYDTETGEVEFIVNPYTMFEYVEFANGNFELSHPKHIRLVVEDTDSPSDIQNAIKSLEESGAYSVKVVTKRSATVQAQVDSEEQVEDINIPGDSLTFLQSHAPQQLKPRLEDLFSRAILEVE